MKLLVVPMFAQSTMSGPWSRVQRIAQEFQTQGHEVILGIADDGNCHNPVTEQLLQLPVPSPMGLPSAISSRTFPVASKLGVMGRKPVDSFEEVLWLTGTLSYKHLRNSVRTIRKFIRSERPDAVYSEFSIPAILAAKAEGVPVVGSCSFPTQASYACDPKKAKGVRRLSFELGLPDFSSALDLFRWLDRRYVPSSRTLDPVPGEDVRFCGFLSPVENPPAAKRDIVLIYLGAGSVPRKKLIAESAKLAHMLNYQIYVAGVADEESPAGNLTYAERLDFSELLPRTAAFINHGGQNSVMDGLSHGAPQIVCPGKVFERQYNASRIESAGAGICLEKFRATDVAQSIGMLLGNSRYQHRANELGQELRSLGGAVAIVSDVEELIAR